MTMSNRQHATTDAGYADVALVVVVTGSVSRVSAW
jgi:hypothetical protein